MNGSWYRVLTKCGPLEKGMTNNFSILALRTPWAVWKGKKIGHWKMNSPDRQVPNMLLEISGEITPERMKGWSQSKNNTPLWMWLVIEARSDTVSTVSPSVPHEVMGPDAMIFVFWMLVMVERSDRIQSTGEGNGKPLQYSCLENPMSSMKRQNDRILKKELRRSVGAQYAIGDQWR